MQNEKSTEKKKRKRAPDRKGNTRNRPDRTHRSDHRVDNQTDRVDRNLNKEFLGRETSLRYSSYSPLKQLSIWKEEHI